MMQKIEHDLSFAHPESGPLCAQTGPFDIVHQPSGARRCTEPCVTTLEPMVAQILMEFRTRGGTGMYSNPDYKKATRMRWTGSP